MVTAGAVLAGGYPCWLCIINIVICLIAGDFCRSLDILLRGDRTRLHREEEPAVTTISHGKSFIPCHCAVTALTNFD